ncbi:MAG: hypothetical protein ACE5JL_01670 [Dehalococcoidia bacterium]
MNSSYPSIPETGAVQPLPAAYHHIKVVVGWWELTEINLDDDPFYGNIVSHTLLYAKRGKKFSMGVVYSVNLNFETRISSSYPPVALLARKHRRSGYQ